MIIACHSYSEFPYKNISSTLFKANNINHTISVLFTAAVSSRPGQCGRADGYILEGKELEFYLKKIKSKKAK